MMDNFKYLKLHEEEGVFTIVVSRPQALNALNIETIGELDVLVDHIYENKKVRGVILTGEGEKAFVAGADIKELATLNAEEALLLAQRGQRVFKKIEDCPKPFIAAINGFALGGGCELAMACHMRIAVESAKLGQPEINLGIIPGYGGTQRLAQLVGRGKAFELLMTGDSIAASDAYQAGLVNHVVANREELMSLAKQIMSRIALKSPGALAKIISAVNAGFSFEDLGYASEANNFAACTSTADFKEGTSAFLEKRKPNFKGE